ncbi:MAG: translocation/assembly module TamB domain-containing protein [Holophagae bacterium]|jgi:hypothetical protein
MGRERRLRYRHLRRTIIAVLAMVAAFLMVALVARLLLTAGPTRRLARQWISNVAEQRDLELEIGELSWGFLPPRVHLEDVRLKGPGIRAEIERASVDLARVRLTRQTVELGTVVATGVRLALDRPERVEPRGDRHLKVRARQLQLSDVELEGSGLPGRIDLDLSGMDAGWSSDGGPPSGFVRIERVELDAPSIRPIVVSLAARLTIDDGLQLPSWTAEGDGISLSGRGTVGGDTPTLIAARGRIDLTTLDRVVKAHNLLSGSIEVAAELTPGEDRERLLSVEVRSRRIDTAGFTVDNVAGRVLLEGDGLRGELDRADFHGGRLRGSYVLDSLHAPYTHRVRVTGRGVEVGGLLGDLDVPDAGIAANFDTEVALDWSGKQLPRGRGRADVALSPTAGALPAAGEVTIELRGDGALDFAADGLRLGESALTWQGPLEIGSWQPSWSITADPANLAEVAPMVNAWVGSRVLPDVEGEGRLQVSLSGPWSGLLVNARIDARPLRLGSVALDRVVASALIGGGRLTLGPSRFQLGDGTGEIEGTLTWDDAVGDDQLAIDLRGHRLPIDHLAAWIGQEGVADGVLSFTGGLRGPIGLPRGSWAAGLDDVRVAGVELGDATATIDLADARFEARGIDFDGGLRGRVWWQVPDNEVGGELDWPNLPLGFLGDTLTGVVGDTANAHLDGRLTPDGRPVGTLDADTPAGRISVHAATERWTIDGNLGDALSGSVRLERVGPNHLAGSGHLRLISAEELLAMVLPGSGIPLVGTATVGIDVDWPGGSTPVISGFVDQLGLELQESPIELLEPGRFELSADGLEVNDLYLAHRADRVFLRWGIAADGSLRGNATGTLDALLLRFLVPEWEPAGRATGVVEMLGTLDRPRFEGIAEIAQGSFRLPGGQTILSGIDGTVLLSSDELVIDGSGFRFMQGRGRANGRIAVRDGAISLDLNGDINGLRYAVFPGLEARVSGPWQISGPVDDLYIGGDLQIDRVSLLRRDDPAVLLVEWFGGESTPSVEGGPSLDLRVEADQTIELRNPFIRLLGSASLQITGTLGRPGIIGKIEFEEGGEVTLQNLRYELERGTFTFSDPDRIDPIVELQLRTWVQNYQVTLRVSGTSDRLVPQVTSNPPLPTEEVYSLLAMGYRSDTLGSGAMGVGLASTLLSQQLTSELDRRTKLVLPQVRVDPFAETATGGPAARVTLVQQLAPNWTVTLQSNLSAERAEVIVSRWYLAPGLFLEASRELDGSYGVDLKMRRPY